MSSEGLAIKVVATMAGDIAVQIFPVLALLYCQLVMVPAVGPVKVSVSDDPWQIDVLVGLKLPALGAGVAVTVVGVEGVGRQAPLCTMALNSVV